jgi:sugar lactone lactonase YvrE
MRTPGVISSALARCAVAPALAALALALAAAPAPAAWGVLSEWGSPGAAPGQFNNPNGIAVAGDRVHVADTLNKRVQVFDPEGRLLAVIPTPEPAWGNGGLNGVAVGRGGDLYVTDAQLDRVHRLRPDGGHVLSWGSSGHEPGQLSIPSGVAVEADGSVLVVDLWNGRIQRFEPDGHLVGVLATEGEAQLRYPSAVAVAPDGSLYVADTGNHRIVHVTREGAFLRAWGGAGSERGRFSSPTSVALAPGGDLWVADLGNQRLQRFTPTGAFVAEYGRGGIFAADLDFPIAVTVGEGGDVYVVNSNSARVKRFGESAGTVVPPGAPGGETGDRTAPTVVLAGARRQRVLRTGVLRIRATANEASRLTIVARVNLAGRPTRLARTTATLGPGAARTLRLRPPLPMRRSLRPVLARRSIAVRVTATARDRAGNVSRTTRTYRIVR